MVFDKTEIISQLLYLFLTGYKPDAQLEAEAKPSESAITQEQA